MLKAVCNFRKVFLVLVVVFSVSIALLIGATTTVADTANIDASVTIKPSLTLNIPINTIAVNLDPATHDFDERDLTIDVGTNNPSGFKLFVTTPNDNTDLVNVADDTKTIPNLTASTAATSFPANKWGYRVTQDSTTSSGDYGVFTSSNSTPVMQSSGPTNKKITTLGFGAKIDYTKPSGQYELSLNFKAVPTVTTEYMQNLDPSVCTEDLTVVIDKRDEQPYTIRRINGGCWMVENLQFVGESGDPSGTMTLNSTTSNVATNTTLAYGELATGDATANSYDDAKIHKGTVTSGSTPLGSTSTTSTVWYNYAAASAGTVVGSSNTSNASYDICPKGWRLPTNTEFSGIISYASSFNLFQVGFYRQGSLNNISSDWWSSVAYGATSRYILLYNGGTPELRTDLSRTDGFFVRCILK